MCAEAWAKAYQDAWRLYYTDEHIETILRRAAVSKFNVRKMATVLTLFAGAVRIEGVHPLQYGYFRRKLRGQRRHGLPLESPLVFYPRRVLEVASGLFQSAQLAWRYHRIMRRVTADPSRMSYTDEALRPAAGDASDMPDFIQAHADRMPRPHKPARQAAAAS
jgi:hypothetical protein